MSRSNNTKIRVGDTVLVIAGRSKGKQGAVKAFLRDRTRVLVEGVNLVKKHRAAGPDGQEGGIIEMEASLHISNVMLVDDEGRRSRVGYRFEDGKKTRFLKSTSKTV